MRPLAGKGGSISRAQGRIFGIIPDMEKVSTGEKEAEGITVLKYGIGFGGKRVALAK